MILVFSIMNKSNASILYFMKMSNFYTSCSSWF